jgi:hypothetical protein
MRLKLSELTPETVESWLKSEVKKRATNAHQSYRLPNAFVKWTQSYKLKDGIRPYRGLVPADACTDADVVKQVPASNTRKAIAYNATTSRNGSSRFREFLAP